MSLPVADQDRAKRFYVERLGFDVVVEADFGDSMRWVQLRPSGA